MTATLFRFNRTVTFVPVGGGEQVEDFLFEYLEKIRKEIHEIIDGEFDELINILKEDADE